MWSWFKKQQAPEEVIRDALGERQLPSFPNLILEVLGMLRDPDSLLADIADKIALDPNVSVKLLGISNSAALAFQHEVRSIQHAVSLLGRASVESILMGLAVSESLKDTSFTVISEQDFWTSAALRAVLARRIARELQPATQDESFTAGLLQDLAIPLISEVKGKRYRGLVEQWWADGGDLCKLEEEEFGWQHGQVAACLCASWKLPKSLCDAIAGHHQQPGTHELPVAVQLVSGLRSQLSRAEQERLVEQLHDDLGVKRDQSVAMLDEVQTEAQELARLLS